MTKADAVGVVGEFLRLMREGERQRRLLAAYPDLPLVRSLPTENLKALWDSYDGAEVTAYPAINGETVHLVLNERGEGDHCRV